MCDGAQPTGAKLAERDACFGGARDAVSIWIRYGYEVRLDLCRIDSDPFRKPTGARVVVGEAVDMMIERVQRGGREDARLP
jgi:hypothetical protein